MSMSERSAKRGGGYRFFAWLLSALLVVSLLPATSLSYADTVDDATVALDDAPSVEDEVLTASPDQAPVEESLPSESAANEAPPAYEPDTLFDPEVGIALTSELDDEFGDSGEDANPNEDTVISENGTFQLTRDHGGTITIEQGVTDVTIVGNGVRWNDSFTMISPSNPNLCIDATAAPGITLTLQDVYLTNTAQINTLDFAGKNNRLIFKGVNLIEHTGEAHYTAAIHVGPTTSLSIEGDGTVYLYKKEQGAGIGGATQGEVNGDITFNMEGGHFFMKGTKQGAVVGSSSGASSSGTPGNITFKAGTYDIVANARGAAVGGSAGGEGSLAGTVKVENNVNLSLWTNYTGATIGGGGADYTNDKPGGTLLAGGASIRAFATANSVGGTINGTDQQVSVIWEYGVSDGSIRTDKKNLDGSRDTVYFPFDTNLMPETSDYYEVRLDGDDFYRGTLHEYAYYAEGEKTDGSDTSESASATTTVSNWLRTFPDSHLYFFLTPEDHDFEVNGILFDLVWDEDARTFNVTRHADEEWALPGGVTATLYGNGDLIFSGEGTLPVYGSFSEAPWAECASRIVSVFFREGVRATDLSHYFEGCPSLVSVRTDLPAGTQRMVRTFAGCASMTTAPLIPSTATDLTECFAECGVLQNLPGGFSVPAGATATDMLKLTRSGLLDTYAVYADIAGLEADARLPWETWNRNLTTYPGVIIINDFDLSVEPLYVVPEPQEVKAKLLDAEGNALVQGTDFLVRAYRDQECTQEVTDGMFAEGTYYARAYGLGTYDGITPAVSFQVASGYHIATAEQLADFADLINDGGTVNGTIYLDADIDLNQLPEGRSFNPIASVNPYFNSHNDGFVGTFDGQGHTVTLANVSATRNGAWIYGADMGLFGALGTVDGGRAVISNLVLKGSITASLSVGALAGKAYNATITNVGSEATVRQNIITLNPAYVGGILGTAYGAYGKPTGSVILERCYSTGKVDAFSQAADAGGLVGGVYSFTSLTLKDCYSTATVSVHENVRGITALGGLFSASTSDVLVTIQNCYSATTLFDSRNTTTCGIAGGSLPWLSQVKTQNTYWNIDKSQVASSGSSGLSGTTSKTTDEMKDASFVSALGSAFAADAYELNSGYPVLAWQAEPYEGRPFVTIDGTLFRAAIEGDAVMNPIQALVRLPEGLSGSVSCQWYRSTYASMAAREPVEGATEATLVPDTSEPGHFYYQCDVTCEGMTGSSPAVSLTVYPRAPEAVIVKQPQSATYTYSESMQAKPLSVEVEELSPEIEVTYQWLYTSIDDSSTGSFIAGATEATYTPELTGVGTVYYFCRITTHGEGSPNNETTVVSDLAAITVENPDGQIIISTADDLRDLSWDINSGETCEGKTVVLANDIDLNDLTPAEGNRNYVLALGVYTARPFKGNFDGRGHRISNWSCDLFTTRPAWGPFGYVIGTSTSPVTIKDVVIDGEVLGSCYLGGIVGYGEYVNLVNCGSEVNVTTVDGANRAFGCIGGVIGYASNCTMTRCYSTGHISGFTGVAGLCGYYQAASALASGTSTAAHIASCYSTATIECEDSTLSAGIACVGYLVRINVKNTYIATRGADNVVLSECAKGNGGGYVSYLGLANVFYNADVLGSAPLYQAEAAGATCNALSTSSSSSQQNVQRLEDRDVRDGTLLKLLQMADPGNWKVDTDGLTNDGYPLLGWQQEAPAPIVPVIESCSEDLVVEQGAEAQLSVEAVASEETDLELAYQWQAVADPQGTSPVAIDGATEAIYEPPTDELGTFYYQCVVTLGDEQATSRVIEVEVTEPTDNGIDAEWTGDGSVKVRLQGDEVVVSATPAEGSYLAQVRYAVVAADEQASSGVKARDYVAVDAADGSCSFAMPEVGDGRLSVVADFVPIVWDGTIDLTWYDPSKKSFTLQYAAQFEGLAAIVNGIFNTYPTGSDGLPDTQAYRAGMGLQADGTSNLYGEFTATYVLSDSQDNYVDKTVTATMRVVGEPSLISLGTGSGTTGDNNQTSTSTYFYGIDDFADKVVCLGADLDFGGLPQGSGWSVESPLYMSLGGQYPMIPGNTNSKIGSSWNGILDGCGHSLSNVYGERRIASAAYGDCVSYGIVGRLGVHDSDPLPAKATPMVRQLVLESGQISAGRSIGGIVGKIGQSPTAPIVEYCINHATVTGTDKQGIGGIVGSSWNRGIVRSCANFGSVRCNATEAGTGFIAGGIVGTSEGPVINCYNVGTITATNSKCAMAIGTARGDYDPIPTNCYWLSGSAPGGGFYINGQYNTTGETEFGGMTGVTLTANMLNGGGSAIWKENDDPSINGGYPLLYFQGGYDAEADYVITLVQPTSGSAQTGTISASITAGAYGDAVVLSCRPAEGYVLDHYTITRADGSVQDLEGDTFALDGNVTVGAVMRQVVALPVTIDNPFAANATLSVTVERLVNGVPTQVALSTGSQVWEGETLTYQVTLVNGATPDNPDNYYTGVFGIRTYYGAGANDYTYATASASSAVTYVVTRSATLLKVSLQSLSEAQKTWDQLADDSWYTGQASSYLISTPAQLAGLAQLVSKGEAFEGVTLSLANDISLADSVGTRLWTTPIGTSSTSAFKGIFDGSGYVIEGMSAQGIGDASALFGYLEGAKVGNLTVAGASTSSGGAAGIAYSAATSSFEGCVSRVTVQASGTQAAGIVAMAKNCTIADCANEAPVSNAGVAAAYTGGIVGLATDNTLVSGCANTAAVSGTSDTGGIAGRLGNGQSVTYAASLKGCSNTGSVTSTNTSTAYAGGLVGRIQAQGCTIDTSFSDGDVAATSSGSSAAAAGGLVGYGYKSFYLDDVFALGSATASSGTGAASAAGLVGSVQDAVDACNGYAAVTTAASTSGTARTAALMATDKSSSVTVSQSNLYYLDSEGASANAGSLKVNLSMPEGYEQAQSAESLSQLGDVLGSAFSNVVGQYPVIGSLALTYTLSYVDPDGKLLYSVQVPAGWSGTNEEVAAAYRGPALASIERVGYEDSTFEAWASASGDPLVVTSASADVRAHALYKPGALVHYAIRYGLSGDEVQNAPGNPETYTIETDTFTIKAPTRPGWNFMGWQFVDANGNLQMAVEYVVAKGSHGDLSLTAMWSENEYALSYVDPNGISQVVSAKAGTAYVLDGVRYEMGRDNVTIPAPSGTPAPGYECLGWSLEKQADGTLAFTSTSGKPIPYAITYSLDGGTNASANPATYTVESGVIVLQAPTRKGYLFLGWVDAKGTPVVAIDSSQLANVSVMARWSPDYGTATISGISSAYTYTGMPITPTVAVVHDGKMLANGEHYTVDYLNNIEVGTATAQVTFVAVEGAGPVTHKVNFSIVAPTDTTEDNTVDRGTLLTPTSGSNPAPSSTGGGTGAPTTTSTAAAPGRDAADETATTPAGGSAAARSTTSGANGADTLAMTGAEHGLQIPWVPIVCLILLLAGLGVGLLFAYRKRNRELLRSRGL